MRCHPTIKKIAVACSDYCIRIWNYQTFEHIGSLKHPNIDKNSKGNFISMNFSHDG